MPSKGAWAHSGIPGCFWKRQVGTFRKICRNAAQLRARRCRQVQRFLRESRYAVQQHADKAKHLQGSRAKLENANFVDKAPADVVQAQRDLVSDLQSQIKVIEDNLKELRQT